MKQTLYQIYHNSRCSKSRQALELLKSKTKNYKIIKYLETALDDFPSHNRGGQGVISMKTSERNGLMVAATLVEEKDGIMLIML